LILKSANIKKGSSEPNKEKVGVISDSEVEKIATIKMDDLNANSLDQAKKMICGTARSMGIEVKG
jgi:large subunit ribosomal protein L11